MARFVYEGTANPECPPGPRAEPGPGRDSDPRASLRACHSDGIVPPCRLAGAETLNATVTDTWLGRWQPPPAQASRGSVTDGTVTAHGARPSLRAVGWDDPLPGTTELRSDMLDPPGGVEGSFRGLSACGPGFRVSMPGWRPGPCRGRPRLAAATAGESTRSP